MTANAPVTDANKIINEPTIGLTLEVSRAYAHKICSILLKKGRKGFVKDISEVK